MLQEKVCWSFTVLDVRQGFGWAGKVVISGLSWCPKVYSSFESVCSVVLQEYWLAILMELCRLGDLAAVIATAAAVGRLRREELDEAHRWQANRSLPRPSPQVKSQALEPREPPEPPECQVHLQTSLLSPQQMSSPLLSTLKLRV